MKRTVMLALMLLAMPALAQDFRLLRGFRTPSNNIHCLAWRETTAGRTVNTLRCQLVVNTAKQPPRPKDCDADWGSSYAMNSTGMAARGCVSDTVYDPKYPVLDYNKTWLESGFTCSVTPQRLRCVNLSGHGFELARAKQRLF